MGLFRVKQESQTVVMNAPPPLPVKRIWSVSFSGSDKPYESWAKHVNVVTYNIHDAIMSVEKQHPGCKIWNVAHRGEVAIDDT